MATGAEQDWTGWITAMLGAIGGSIGTVAIAFVNRKPALQVAVDSAVKTLIEGYKARIDDLTSEVHSLRSEVQELRKALDDRPRQNSGFGI